MRWPADNPTLAHAFLDSLHRSGCAAPRTGWAPRFPSLWEGDRLLGAAPLYVKTHSYGEYVFDWAWADAHERHGLAYYPKLLCAVPFTPATGPRLLAANDAVRSELAARAPRAREALGRLVRARALSRRRPMPRRCAPRAGSSAPACSSTGTTPGYASFEAFLAQLSHDKRKKIRQERRKVAEAGIAFRRVTGRDATEADWDFFTACYRRTYRAHRSTPYLNREFFGLLGEPHARQRAARHRRARRHARGRGARTSSRAKRALRALLGRHGVRPRPALRGLLLPGDGILHRARIPLFEGGAQGEHKHARGFLPSVTRSFHWLAHPAFYRAVDDYLEREGAHIDAVRGRAERPQPVQEKE